MPKLHPQLVLERCPHCAVAKPNLRTQSQLETRDHTGGVHRLWYVYVCSNCGGVVTAWSLQQGLEVVEIFPCPTQVSEDIPNTSKAYLSQAIASVHAPSGAVMLAASAVDSMLKEINYKKGSLYERIEQAVKDNLITSEMARWAHDVRLDANDQRHADETVSLPNTDDAKRVIDFATAFAEYLFVLPAKIKRGLKL